MPWEVLVRPFLCTTLLMMTGLPAAQQPSASTADVKSKLEQGMSAFRAHEYKRALAIFNKVTAFDPNNILAHNLAGNCSMESGDFAAAIHSFESASNRARPTTEPSGSSTVVCRLARGQAQRVIPRGAVKREELGPRGARPMWVHSDVGMDGSVRLLNRASDSIKDHRHGQPR